jgi:hypothetical protein
MRTVRMTERRKLAMRAAGVLSAAGVLVITACTEPVVGPSGGRLALDEARSMAVFLADIEQRAGLETFLENVTGTRDFASTTPCPAGGSVTVAGSGESSLDAEARIVNKSWSTTHTHDACAFEVTRRGDSYTVVTNGGMTASGTASYRLPDERGGPRTLLAYTARRTGSTTTTVGDRTRTCDVDITETYDPASGSFVISGTTCGQQVRVTRTQGQRAAGAQRG